MTCNEHTPSTGSSADSVPIRRLFDDGGPMLFKEEAGDGFPWPGIVVHSSSCESPTCECRDVDFLARPLVRRDETLGEHPEVSVEGRLHLDTGMIVPHTEPGPTTPQAALLARVRLNLAGDRLGLLRARWHRAKHQDDPDEWRTVDWSRVDLTANVAFCEIFPSRWDLAVGFDRHHWWIFDLWCLKPGCTCELIGLSFHREDGNAEALVEVDLPNRSLAGRPTDTDRGLWEALREEKETLAELDSRRSTIRRISRKLPAFLASPRAAAPPPGAGRNEPCPCGSGKKFKRCCGGVGAR
jgi:hypothetical protein